jgi:hypothetical protein
LSPLSGAQESVDVHAATRSWIDWTAAVAGAGVAVVAVFGWEVEGRTQAPPARVVLETASQDDLTITPAGVTSAAQDLTAGGRDESLERKLGFANPTAGAVLVRVHARPATGDLDDHLRVRVKAAGQAALFDGQLGELRTGSRPFALGAFEGTDVRVLAWLPADAEEGWEARNETIRLEFTTSPAAP